MDVDATVDAAVADTTAVTLPAGRSIVNTTVAAAGSVSLGSRDNILGPTASGNGPAELQSQGVSMGITSGGSVTLDSQAKVDGNVVAAGRAGYLGDRLGFQGLGLDKVLRFTNSSYCVSGW